MFSQRGDFMVSLCSVGHAIHHGLGTRTPLPKGYVWAMSLIKALTRLRLSYITHGGRNTPFSILNLRPIT